MDDLRFLLILKTNFGPKLANGNPSIIFVSDNNFSDKQKTQVLVLRSGEVVNQEHLTAQLLAPIAMKSFFAKTGLVFLLPQEPKAGNVRKQTTGLL
jgi:hypothetical protein